MAILIAAGALAPAAQTSPKKSKAAPKQPSRIVASRPASKPPVKGPNRGRSRVTSTKTTAKSSKIQPKPVRRSGQQTPSPERYREIQQALADRGYLKGQPTGRWDEESVEALRRFEQDQSLKPDGKLDSLALIALGLGPKRTTLTDPNLGLAAQP